MKMFRSELAYLPGGFHACCLSTFLDAHECSVVRATAGAVFAELLRHVDARQHQRRCLLPVYGSEPSEPNDSAAATVEQCTDTIFEMLVCHRFSDTMSHQLEAFWTGDSADNGTRTVHISWCVVRTFCTIAGQLVRLRQARAVGHLHDAGLVLGPIRLLAAVQQIGSQRAVRMLVEVCRYVAACVRCAGAGVMDAVAQGEEPVAVRAMIACMDPGWYDQGAGLDDVLQPATVAALRPEALRALLSVCAPLAANGDGMVALLGDGEDCGQRVEVLVRLMVFAWRAEPAPVSDTGELAVLALELLRNLLQWVPTGVCDGGEAMQTFGELMDVVMVRTTGEDEANDAGLAAELCFRALHELLKKSRGENL